MTHYGFRSSGTVLLFLFMFSVIFVCIVRPLPAADPQDNPSGFSFHSPRIFFGGHAGMNFPQAKGAIFNTAIRDLTLEKSDFHAPVYGGDFGVYIGSHFAVVGSFDYSRVSARSEYRHFVEDNGNSIFQTTRFSQWSVLGTFRYYPIKTGETVGNFSWIPTRILPYVGAGLGLAHYDFTQEGDFVNFANYDINTDKLFTSNPALMTHVSAGMDFALTRRIIVNVEGRYSWAKGDISVGLNGIRPDYYFGSSAYAPQVDLNAFRVVGGVYFRF
jgi:opacity protein-like surface antigen